MYGRLNIVIALLIICHPVNLSTLRVTRWLHFNCSTNFHQLGNTCYDFLNGFVNESASSYLRQLSLFKYLRINTHRHTNIQTKASKDEWHLST